MRSWARRFHGLALVASTACGATVPASPAPSASESDAGAATPVPTAPAGPVDSDGGERVDVCTIGDRACYGEPKLAGVGACKLGVQTCERTGEIGHWGACVGSGAPSAETCGNGVDDDCNGVVDEGCECAPGATMPCYGGPSVTLGVGQCHAGVQTCGADGKWAASCTGAVTPAIDTCNGVDDDCDGVVDQACACTIGASKSCYDGPGGTNGVGSCHAGTRTCAALPTGGSAFGDCVGEVLPKPTSPYGADDDCDGSLACVFASTTIAGTLSVLPSTPPEDGTGSAAHFGTIKGVRVDPTNGDLVLIETTSTGARFIRRVTAAGVTTTVGKVDVNLHADLGVGQDGTVYFVEGYAPHAIRVFPKVGAPSVRASAPLPTSNVQAFTVDASDWGWVAMPSPDHADHVRISRLSLAGGGVAETMFEVPTYNVLDLAVAGSGEVYVADSGQMWRWSPGSGVSAWGAGGAHGVSVDAAGHVARGGAVYSHDGDLLFAVDKSVTPHIHGGSFMSAFDGSGGLYTFDLARFDPQVTYYEYAGLIRHLTGCVLPLT